MFGKPPHNHRMKTIDLTKDKKAVVDDSDFAELSKHKWHAIKSRNTFYARRTDYANGKKAIYMHIVVLGNKDGFMVDHRNGNGLDNRRPNLRFATNSQSAVNQKTRNDNTSGCRGVHWHKGSGKWQARIRVNQKYQTLGTFLRIDDAIQAYQNAAKLHFGDYRR